MPFAGTRGDVQHGVILGAELRRRGHDVIFGAAPNLVEFARKAGLDTRPCGPDIQSFYSSAKGQHVLASGRAVPLVRYVSSEMARYATQMSREVADICTGADVIVSLMITEDRASVAAEAMDIPQVTLHPYPCRSNGRYPMQGVLPPHWRLPGPVTRGSWALVEAARTASFGGQLNAMRKELGLAPSRAGIASTLRERGVPEIQVYEPAIMPGLEKEWDSQRPFTGYLSMSPEIRAAVGELGDDHDGILDWIDNGEPPVYFGFGSMPFRDGKALLEMIQLVSARLGIRALVSAGWTDLDAAGAEQSSQVRTVGQFAHDVVLPWCRAAVHHGGIGTITETLRAGLPTVVCSVAFEQPLCGVRVRRLGIGAHIPFHTLTAQRLEDALDSILTPGHAQRATGFAKQLRANGNIAARTAGIVEAAA